MALRAYCLNVYTVVEGVDMIPVLQPTALRTNPLYSIYFNWFRFIAIGIIPFALLVSTKLFFIEIWYVFCSDLL